MLKRTIGLAATLATLLAAVAPGAHAAPSLPIAVSGHKVTVVASGLKTPTAFAFGDDTLFAADGGSPVAHAHNGAVDIIRHGRPRRIAHSPALALGVVWHHNALYVSGEWRRGTALIWQLQRWSGFDGTRFASQTVLYTAPRGFEGFNGLAFGPDGRLYVGADVGINNGNDDGPASTSPYLYDILSFTARGTGLKVFASGIRQPWQMVFAKGSSSPLVSDLGPDYSSTAGAYDAVLRVRAGQDYQFPDCILSPTTPCPGAPRPLATFTEHTTIEGLAIIGSTLYMSSFNGLDPTHQVGEVSAMPVSGGAAVPVVTGFPTHVVGLGAVGGRLYFGDLTGRVYSVTPSPR